MGRDRHLAPRLGMAGSFNPRARMGRDQEEKPWRPAATSFNPRARMGRDVTVAVIRLAVTSFNPRARMGRDPSIRGRHPRRLVSIHAPAWGATSPRRSAPARRPSFNPRARMGRDKASYSGSRCSAWFQSTRPHGARRVVLRLSLLGLVSIHAPAWGATPVAERVLARTAPFQSTRPHGARPAGRRNSPRRPGSFNPRARMGRDAIELDALEVAGDVSIHAPAWGATRRGSVPGGRRCFNPRARMGRDVPSMVKAVFLTPFQSTRPHGARHRPRSPALRPLPFQSTRPHGARRADGHRQDRRCPVSIHAPAWGATQEPRLPGEVLPVSIHAPAWGATRAGRGSRPGPCCFNPRARMGRDLRGGGLAGRGRGFNPRARMGRDLEVVADALALRRVSIHAPAWGATLAGYVLDASQLTVSIHAPAWGATRLYRLVHPRPRRFNPRARMGRDCPACAWPCAVMAFQSTRPHGARRGTMPRPPRPRPFQSTRPHGARQSGSSRWSRSVRCFNPRARMGRDAFAGEGVGDPGLVSIHAPAWGATHPSGLVAFRLACFNPRARMGRDQEQLDLAWQVMGFNPRARMGRDLTTSGSACSARQFQSTRPHGARPDIEEELIGRGKVSIHAPAWGATLRPLPRPVIGSVSIHAPAWGATDQDPSHLAAMAGFNPRARMGRDQQFGQVAEGVILVSIHAPAWGATRRSSSRRSGWSCFNPRARMGRDCLSPSRSPSSASFNPRARMGRDLAIGGQDLLGLVSIHAPAWGATVPS